MFANSFPVESYGLLELPDLPTLRSGGYATYNIANRTLSAGNSSAVQNCIPVFANVFGAWSQLTGYFYRRNAAGFTGTLYLTDIYAAVLRDGSIYVPPYDWINLDESSYSINFDDEPLSLRLDHRDRSINIYQSLRDHVLRDAGINLSDIVAFFPILLPTGASSDVSAQQLINNLIVAYTAAVPHSDHYYTYSPALFASPFASGAIPISALPFRHYEAIYNSFYRNQKVDPFIKQDANGIAQPTYNEWNTTTDGGQDNTYYDFFYRNWEDDFLTTATQSPQQGIAPLVGVNSMGEFTFEDASGQRSVLRAVVSDDGRLTGIDSVDPGIPAGALSQLMSSINHGISINDFRNVNSLQRWLEKNLRRGYKYRDLVRAHTGVTVHYNELDMPEFIGGISDVVSVSKILNTNGVDSSTPLGEFAGSASLFSTSNHTITKYCDESGFIIGILSIVPVPVYQSLLPKYFIKTDALDYYDVLFSKIGMQPIYNKEVAPIQALQNGTDINGLWGYQKAWYDYFASTDEAHGEMRTSINDYLMMRKFASVPELGKDFIHVDPASLNNVFADTSSSDKVFGAIFFECFAKRPISVPIAPSIE